MLEKTLEGPLDSREIKPVNPKENQSWIFIGKSDAKAEAPILWPPDVKSWLIRKDPDARKDWRQEEKGETEDEMVGWHHWLNGHKFEPTLGDSEGQWSLVCCSSWDHKDSDTTQQLNQQQRSRSRPRAVSQKGSYLQIMIELCSKFLITCCDLPTRACWRLASVMSNS